jgi:hypothetical protein
VSYNRFPTVQSVRISLQDGKKTLTSISLIACIHEVDNLTENEWRLSECLDEIVISLNFNC